MPARRCSLCGINYPTGQSFAQCPIHKDERTAWFQNAEPDEDWEKLVAIATEHLQPAEDDSLDELIPAVNTRVVTRPDGSFVVSSWDVHASLRRYKPIAYDEGQLIRVGKQTFEIVQYLEEERQYVVNSFATELSEEDLARLVGA